MATQAQITMPSPFRNSENMAKQRSKQSDGGNTFIAGAFVKLATGVLATLATGDVVIYGQTPDKSHLSTDRPPDALYGENHWPFDLAGVQFDINVGHANGTDVTIGASAKTPADVTLGSQYGILVPTTGVYAGVPFLDPTNTSTKLFRVISKVDGVAETDQNGKVRAQLIGSVIQ